MSTKSRALRVETPCDNRWEDLEPREGGRWCGQCRRVVLDLMSATEGEAWRAFDAAGGDICVRIRPGADGDAVFRSPPRRVSTVAAVAFGAALAACDGGGDATTSAPEPVEQTIDEPPADVERAQTAEPAEPNPTATDDPTSGDAPEALEGTIEHPAHPGEIHTSIHERHHGRMGGAVARPRDPDPVDLLEGL